METVLFRISNYILKTGSYLQEELLFKKKPFVSLKAFIFLLFIPHLIS